MRDERWAFYEEFNGYFRNAPQEAAYYSICLLEERIKFFEGVMV
jgi:hypothetical protein